MARAIRALADWLLGGSLDGLKALHRYDVERSLCETRGRVEVRW